MQLLLVFCSSLCGAGDSWTFEERALVSFFLTSSLNGHVGEALQV